MASEGSTRGVSGSFSLGGISNVKRLSLLLAVLALGGCRTLQLDAPVRLDESDWWTTGGSAEHNSSVDASLVPPLSEAWSYNALAAFGPGSALVVGDVVLVANLQGEIHAIDLEKGKRVGQAGFSEAIAGTPAIGRGRLVVGTAWGRRTLQGYDLERGDKLWRRDGPHITAGLLAYEDDVLVADLEGGVRLVDMRDGADLWHYEDPGNVSVLATPVLTNGLYIVPFQDGTVRAFRPGTGQVAWTTGLELPLYASPTASDGRIYLPTTRGVLIVLDARSGTEMWRFQAASEAVKIASPSIRDGVIYFGASDGFVRAISTEFGEARWRMQVDAAVAAQVLVTDSYVYLGTMDNRLMALDSSDGSEVWRTELRGRVKSALAVAGGGLLVLMEPRFVSLFLPEAVDATN
jgi:outer membrane protein assembly factor BamB